MSRWSLRRRLLVLLLASTCLLWTGTAVYSYFDARHEIGELLDAHLAQAAALIAARLDAGRPGEHHDGDDEDESGQSGEPVPRAHRYERRVAFQVWRDERLESRSASAPRQRLSATAEGFSDVRHEGVAWRVFGRREAGDRVLILVGERAELRRELAGELTRHLLHPLVVALPLLGVLIWIGVGQGLAPLTELGQQLRSRSPDRLEPLDVAKAPREVAPLLASLNDLFVRVAAALENERRFTASAAHELRTPLAALRAQAQVAQRASDEPQRQHALRQVIAGCDRAARLVEQLLTAARLEPREARARLGRVDLQAIAAEVLAELAPQALAKRIELTLDGQAAAVSGDGELLRLLLRNLADNAIRYTPAGGTVAVSTVAVAGGAELVVTDSGPGVPEAMRGRLGERFFRVLDSGEPGSGLGLSIVRRICELHAADLGFAPGASGHGLTVTVGLRGPHSRD